MPEFDEPQGFKLRSQGMPFKMVGSSPAKENGDDNKAKIAALNKEADEIAAWVKEATMGEDPDDAVVAQKRKRLKEIFQELKSLGAAK